MRPADIRPAQAIRPVKRRWYAPEQQQPDEEPPHAEPPAEPPPLRDSDDEHIDEYAR